MNSTLHTISSGSKGNCYVLTAMKDRLILESGVSYKLLLSALDYDIVGVQGIIVSHSHG